MSPVTRVGLAEPGPTWLAISRWKDWQAELFG
jgi:hypothetical protein